MLGTAVVKATPYRATLDSPINGVRYQVEFQRNPFDEGACRYAFKGFYIGDGAKNGTQCVTKIFKEEAARSYQNYLPDQRASQKANEFAQAFNAEYNSSKPIRFIIPEMATVDQLFDHSGDNLGETYVRPGDNILVEDFIPGNYVKFNNNDVGLRDDVAAIPAFSHYTYWKSDGQFLVCDIQGVRTPTGYTLTDPAVLSRRAGQFGPTDVGPSGMAKFFSVHRCTSVCRNFPMPKFDNSRRINRGRADRSARTYTFMIGREEQQANEEFSRRNDLPSVDE